MPEPYHQTPDGKVTLLHGHVLDVLREMPAESVNCVVTSPPYWSLRKYDCEPVIWGGDSGCEHEWGHQPIEGEAYTGDFRWQHMSNQGPKREEIEPTRSARRTRPDAWAVNQLGETATCSLCGAWRGQYGLEPTPELYVEHTLMWLREVRRVLRKDGTLWLNLGDGYAASPGQRKETDKAGPKQLSNTGSVPTRSVSPDGLKPKDAVLMPFRVALAAQADGWWVRSVIVWHKTNPMPESVRDRPTDAHEYVIRLEKDKPPLDERDIIWLAASLDSDGCIRVGKFGKRYAGQVIFSGKDERLVQHFAALSGVGSVSSRPHERGGRQWMWRTSDATAAWLLQQVEPYLVSKRAQAHVALALEARKDRSGNKIGDEEWAKRDRLFQMSKALNSGKGGSDVPLAALPEEDYQYIFLLTRSKSYWYDADAIREPMAESSIARISQPTFDRQTGGPKDYGHGVNPNRSARRALENFAASHKGSRFDKGKTAEHQLGRASSELRHDNANGRNCRSVWTFPTEPWPLAHFAVFPRELPTRCIKAGAPVGGVVLDPFAGSGTTCEVAYHLGRTAIGIDASAKYLDMARERVKQGALL